MDSISTDKGIKMQTIEFETKIEQNGHIYLPEKFQHAYGKSVRLFVFLPEGDTVRTKKRKPGSAKRILRILSEDNEHLDDFMVIDKERG